MTREHAATPSPESLMQTERHHGFLIGMLTGGVIGAGLGWLLAPRVSALGRQTADSLKDLSAATTHRYEEAGERLAAVMDGITEKGQELRDHVSDAVIHGARAVEHRAEQVKSGR